MEVSVQLHAPASLPPPLPGKELLVPIGPQSLSGRGGEEKNSQSLPGLEPPRLLVSEEEPYSMEFGGWLGLLCAFTLHQSSSGDVLVTTSRSDKKCTCSLGNKFMTVYV
jgi:hypothetical protein